MAYANSGKICMSQLSKVLPTVPQLSNPYQAWPAMNSDLCGDHNLPTTVIVIKRSPGY